MVTGTVIEGSIVEPDAQDAPDIPARTAATGAGRDATGRDGAAAEQDAVPGASIPTQTVPDVDDADDGYVDDDEYADDDPPGEPPPQLVSPADAALVARMDVPVLVADGRPRYHRSGCGFLRGRATEPLPVSEAVELGFTPCSRCEPDTALIAGARSG